MPLKTSEEYEDYAESIYLLPTYNFRVEINSKSFSFAEVSGLTAGYELIEFKHSSSIAESSSPKSFSIRGQEISANITMKRGLANDASAEFLYAWVNDLKKDVTKKYDINIYLRDEKGADILHWTVQGAFPTRIDAPTFNTMTNEIAVETLTLVADAVIFNKTEA